MEDATVGEVLTGAIIGIGVVGGAAYGWLAGDSVWAIIGGAVVIGTGTLVLVSVVSLAAEVVARPFRRRGDR